MKTDKDGNKLWEKSYGLSSRSDDAANLFQINNNEYVIGGYIGPNQGVPWNEWHHQIQIFAVDSSGNEKWYWESDPVFDAMSTEDRGCYGLQRNDAGDWMYVTRRSEYQSSFGGWYEQGEFVVRDSNFNLIIAQTYDEVGGDQIPFLNLVSLNDGDWLTLGANYEEVENPVQALAHNYGYLNRISSGKDGITELGDSLWTRSDIIFPDTAAPQQLFFHSAVELPSGSIIVAGYFTGFGYTDHGLLIKVNQHGCVDTTNCIPTNFPNIIIANNEIASPDLKVYPNPARHILHIESDLVPVWDKVELLDMTGRVVKVVAANKKITLEDLPSGLYVLRLWKAGRFWTRKVVRQ